jgi:hypothetical protein
MMRVAASPAYGATAEISVGAGAILAAK